MTVCQTVSRVSSTVNYQFNSALMRSTDETEDFVKIYNLTVSVICCIIRSCIINIVTESLSLHVYIILAELFRWNMLMMV